MAALLDVYLKKETLEKILKTLELKEAKGVAFTISANDETNEYGQNVSAWVSQSKEDREAKKERYFVGNGKVFWEDGKIVKAVRTDQQPATVGGEDDLPF